MRAGGCRGIRIDRGGQSVARRARLRLCACIVRVSDVQCLSAHVCRAGRALQGVLTIRFPPHQGIRCIDNCAAVAASSKSFSMAMVPGLIVKGMHAALMAPRSEPYLAYVYMTNSVADLPSQRRAATAPRGLRRAGIGGERQRVAQVRLRPPRLRKWRRPVRDWHADATQF